MLEARLTCGSEQARRPELECVSHVDEKSVRDDGRFDPSLLVVRRRRGREEDLKTSNFMLKKDSDASVVRVSS